MKKEKEKASNKKSSMKNRTIPADELMKTNPSLWKALVQYRQTVKGYKEKSLSELTARELRQLSIQMLNECLPQTEDYSVITLTY